MNRSYRIWLVAICFCIAFGISAKCSSTNLPPTPKLQDNYAQIDYHNFVDSLENWLNTKEKSKYEYFSQHIQKLQESIVANNNDMMRRLGKLQAAVTNNAARFASLEKSVTDNLDALRSKLRGIDRVERDIYTFSGRMNKEMVLQSKKNKLAFHQTEQIRAKLKQHRSEMMRMRAEFAHCVTDIKVSASEELRRPDGFSSDKSKKAITDAGDKGYFLTAVTTLNAQSFAIKRRAISFRRKHNWIPLHA